MTFTSYTQSAAFIWTNQCVETGSSAFAIPALSCYIIIVTAAIVGIWVVCFPIVVDRNLRNNLLLPLSLVTSDLAIKVIVGVPLDIETFLYTTSEFMGSLHARYGSQYSSPRCPRPLGPIFLLLADCASPEHLSDPLIHLRRSPFMTRKRALITILIFFIWLYSVLFAAIPSMGWRDAPGAKPLFLKVFGGFLTPKLTLYLQLPELLSTVYYHQRYSYQDLWHCT